MFVILVDHMWPLWTFLIKLVFKYMISRYFIIHLIYFMVFRQIGNIILFFKCDIYIWNYFLLKVPSKSSTRVYLRWCSIYHLDGLHTCQSCWVLEFISRNSAPRDWPQNRALSYWDQPPKVTSFVTSKQDSRFTFFTFRITVFLYLR